MRITCRYDPLPGPLEEGMQRARPANDHRGGCSAEDYEIKGRTGVTGVTGPSVNACSRSRIHKMQGRKDTEVHCAFTG